jgi:leucyl-tRNA synthetase
MELMNEMYKAREAGAAGKPEWNEALELYLLMSAPVTPFAAEELWQSGKPTPSINKVAAFDPAAAEEQVTLVVG